MRFVPWRLKWRPNLQNWILSYYANSLHLCKVNLEANISVVIFVENNQQNLKARFALVELQEHHRVITSCVIARYFCGLHREQPRSSFKCKSQLVGLEITMHHFGGKKIINK